MTDKTTDIVERLEQLACRPTVTEFDRWASHCASDAFVELTRLHSLNKDLVEALEAVVMELMPAYQRNCMTVAFRPTYERARAALAKASEETK
jgi:hypothetical protein